MSTSRIRSTACWIALGVGLMAATGLAGAGFAESLGEPVSESDLAAWDISIGPDGVGLPGGKGSVAEGAVVWTEQCAACHGETGIEGPADVLVGGIGTLASDAPVKTVGSYWPYATGLFDYIRRAMPYSAPRSLSDGEVYAVTAYLLHLNDILQDDAVLDAETLPAVTMPNSDGFIAYWPKAPN